MHYLTEMCLGSEDAGYAVFSWDRQKREEGIPQQEIN